MSVKHLLPWKTAANLSQATRHPKGSREILLNSLFIISVFWADQKRSFNYPKMSHENFLESFQQPISYLSWNCQSQFHSKWGWTLRWFKPWTDGDWISQPDVPANPVTRGELSWPSLCRLWPWNRNSLLLEDSADTRVLRKERKKESSKKSKSVLNADSQTWVNFYIYIYKFEVLD